MHDGDAADALRVELVSVVAAQLRDFAQHGDCFVGDFGADAVAGSDENLQLHSLSSVIRDESVERRVSRRSVQFRHRLAAPLANRVGKNADQVLVVDVLLAVGQRDKAVVGLLQFFAR